MGSIDKYDDELSQKKERYTFRFTVNFKKIYMMNTVLFEDNRDWDDTYPRNIFITMLEGIWVGMTVLFAFSQNVLLIVTLPFIFFYGLALFRTYKTWKEYKYPTGQFWLYNLLGLVVSLTLGILFQVFVLKI